MEQPRGREGVSLPLVGTLTDQHSWASPALGVSTPPTSPTSVEEQSARLLPSAGEKPQLQPQERVSYINRGEDEEAEVHGYCRSAGKTALTWVLIALTLGFLRLVFHWRREWMLKATHNQCSLAVATRVLVVERYGKYRRCFVKDVQNIDTNRIEIEKESSIFSDGLSSQSEKESVKEKTAEMKELPKETLLLAVPLPTGDVRDVAKVRAFTCKKMLYVWDEEDKYFYKLAGIGKGQTGETFHCYEGMSFREQCRRRAIYGDNAIKVPIKPLWKLLFQEALSPFYIFQLFSVILWYTDDYMYYATVIVITSVASLVSQVYQMDQNQKSLSARIQSTDRVEVMRDKKETESISSDQLVPGDVIVIPPQGCMMQCDAVIQQGNVIVNEAMLTGESVPVTKVPFVNRADVFYSEKEHARHTLFCGTQVIQTRFYRREKVTAVVIRTGFLTSKGSLVRSIMYPPPVDFKFQQDAYKFIVVLACIASFGFIYTAVTKKLRGLSAKAIAVDSLDLITIVVPPALPMAMTVGILYALRRLKDRNIFCISPRSINLSGVLNCVCFDKTGTLTEDGLDMKGIAEVIKVGRSNRLSPITQPKSQSSDHFIVAMATCHSITIINDEKVGDPLDLKMFESTGWVLEEPGEDGSSKYDTMIPSVVKSPEKDDKETLAEVGILRQFPFSSSLQRMSVITRRLNEKNVDLYTKGSPEMIVSLSRPETVPLNFHEELKSYTDQGYRVLAVAWKPLPKFNYLKVQRTKREEVEHSLEFLGLLILENRLKSKTTPTIRELRRANIRTVMITGDNMSTALSVGRECGIVDVQDTVITVSLSSAQGDKNQALSLQQQAPKKSMENGKIHHEAVVKLEEVSNYCFALDGKAWSVIVSQEKCRDLLNPILVKGAVFARMNPDQKQQLIRHLQSLGYCVGMCGDGANDCGALKAAHAGISLSDTEASVASPFTSKTADISCTPALIREGRTALVTSFGIFKYMAAYSLTQFISVMILYSIDSNLTDLQFLYIDLFLITVFAFFFGRTGSFEGPLSRQSPPASLISLAPIASLLIHMVVIALFQTGSYFYVQQQPWFVPFNQTNSETVLAGHENYAVYSLSQFQYIILAFVFSKGRPYRKVIFTNYYLMASLVIMTAFSIYMTVDPGEWFIQNFELVLPPRDDPAALFFRWSIIILALCNALVAIFVEYVLIDHLLYRKCKGKFRSSNKSKKYLKVEHEFTPSKFWSLTNAAQSQTIKNEVMINVGAPPDSEANGNFSPL